MNEIERAIEFLESYINFMKEDKHPHYDKVERPALETALNLCRAELSRQENAPLTCEGCRWIDTKYSTSESFNYCWICSRGLITDRYEPKGENE